jgi:cytochrome b subunit of formate dehydrogenase
MATDDPSRIERYNARTRWFHAAVYLTVLPLLGTGWWLLVGREGRPSPLARATGLPDTDLHRYAGWVLLGLAVLALTVGVRAARTFAAASVRFRRDDARWVRQWPRAAFTGRFAVHDGHFDPGQRVLNVLLVVLLAILAGSGVGLMFSAGGETFVWLHRIHRYSTYAVTPLLLGHIAVAAGILPGYWGVGRSMHGGRIRASVARRIWPVWAERELARRRAAVHSGAPDVRPGGDRTAAG